MNGANNIVIEPINAAGLLNNDWTMWFDWLDYFIPTAAQYLADAVFNNPDAGRGAIRSRSRRQPRPGFSTLPTRQRLSC